MAPGPVPAPEGPGAAFFFARPLSDRAGVPTARRYVPANSQATGKRGERGQAANLFPLLRQLRHELALLPDGGKKLLLLPQLDHEAVKEGVELAERACELHDSELGAADDEPLRKPAACPGGDFATPNVKLG